MASAPGTITDAQAGEAREDTERNAAGFPNPLIVHRIFEEECHEEDQRNGAHPADPCQADLGFELPRVDVLGFWSGESRRGRTIYHFVRDWSQRRRVFLDRRDRGEWLRLGFTLPRLWLGWRDTDSERGLEARQTTVALVLAANEAQDRFAERIHALLFGRGHYAVKVIT